MPRMNKAQIKSIVDSMTPEMLFNSEFSSYKDEPWSTPLEFFESDRFCGLHLYPNQRLMLKLWNLQIDDLTDYENKTLDEWCKSFKNDKYKVGVLPDIRERIAELKKNGYKHFSTIIEVFGRRASKSFMSGNELALADAQMLWHGIPSVQFDKSLADEQDEIVGGSDFWQQDKLDDTQDSSGIDKDTAVYSIVMATTMSQAQETIFKDYYNAVLSCQWLQQYILRITPFQITYQTPNDKLKTLDYLERGIPIERELASMVSRPVSSNSNAVRGRAVAKFTFDEVWFSKGGESSLAGDRMIAAITPATQTFGKDRLIMYPSSPWTRSGRVYQLYLQGQTYVDEYLEAAGMSVTQSNRENAEDEAEEFVETQIADPSIFVAQLESWRLYEHCVDEAFVPTYWSGWSPKKLVLENESGDTIEKTAFTNADVGNYVSLHEEDGDES